MSVSATIKASQAIKEGFRLPPLPTIGDILRIYRVRALKRLAQNFLLDQKLTDKMVRAAGNLKDACVLEVGPGPGCLTRSILNAGVRELSVIEKDTRFIPIMEQLKDACEIPFHVCQGDILKYDIQEIFPEDTVRPWNNDELPPLHIIANLPFNVSTPLLIRWLSGISNKSGVFRYGRVQMTLMFQHEVCQRIIAWSSDKQRCRLSVMCQNYCDTKYVFPVKGTSFLPKPKVDAGVVHLIPKKEPIIKQPFSIVEKVVRNMFNQRKKYLHNCTKTLFPEKYEHFAMEMVNMAKLDDTKSPFTLEIEEFGELIKAYQEICKSVPGIESYQFR